MNSLKWNGVRVPKFNNCLVCYLRPSLYFGCLSITALKFNCIHNQRPSKVFFKRSYVFSICGLLLTNIMVAVGIYDIYTIITGDGDLTFVINESCIALLSGSLCMFGNYKVTEKAIDLRDLADLIEVAQKQGLVFLDDLFAFKCWIFTWWAILSCCVLQFILIAQFVIFGNYSFHAVKTAICDLYILMEATVGVHFLLMIIVFIKMFNKISSELKELLLKKNRLKIIQHEYMILDNRLYNFEHSIQWLRKLYSSAFIKFMSINNFMSQCFLFWWNGVVIISTATHYLAIKKFMDGSWSNMYIIILIKLYFGIFSIAVYLGFMEVLHTAVSRNKLNLIFYNDIFKLKKCA